MAFSHGFRRFSAVLLMFILRLWLFNLIFECAYEIRWGGVELAWGRTLAFSVMMGFVDDMVW